MYTLIDCVKEKNTYKNIVLVDETGKQYYFQNIVDLKAVKDNYIGDNYYFDGKYQFARCKDKMYANEMYTDDVAIDSQLLIDLEKACVGMDNIYSSLYHTLKTDLGEEREDAYSFFNLMNCSEKSLCTAYVLNFAKQAMPKMPLLQDLYSIDYKSHSAMENDSRRSGLFTSDARRFVLRKSDTNFYTYFVDITLFLSNIFCFTMAGKSDEKGLVSDYLEHVTEERPYNGYLKGTACNPYQFEDKILIDFYCVAYLYYLKEGNNSVSFTFKYKDTKTGLQSIRALMRNVLIAYFAAKRVYCRCSNTKPKVLNNMLNDNKKTSILTKFYQYVQGVRNNYRDYVAEVSNSLYV